MLHVHPRRLEAATWDALWSRWSIDGPPALLAQRLLQRPLGVWVTPETVYVAARDLDRPSAPVDLLGWEDLRPARTLVLAEPANQLEFSSDGRWIAGATGEMDEPTITLFDGRTGEVVDTVAVEDEAFDFTLDPAGRFLVVVRGDNPLRFYGIDEGRLVPGPELGLGAGEEEEAGEVFAFHPREPRVAVSGPSVLGVCNAVTGRSLWEINRIELAQPGVKLAALDLDVTSNPAFTPDGRRLVCGSNSGGVLVLDAETGRVIENISVGSDKAVRSIGVHGQGAVACALVGDEIMPRVVRLPG